jgi:TonB family protein
MRIGAPIAIMALSLAMATAFPSVLLGQEQAARKVQHRVVPVYPELARKMQLRGTVRVEAVVAPNGTVRSTEVKGGSPVLATAALDAITKWTWAAAPHETTELIELNFHP